MRGTLRRGARVLAFVALALLLTGCLKLDEHLTLNPDNTVDGTITVGISKQLIQMSGQSADDVLKQMTQGSDSPVPSGVADVQTKDYEDDQFVGKTYTFSGATLDQVNSQGGDLSITRNADTFVVDGTLDLSSGSASGIDLNDPTTKTMMQSFQVSIGITFPGAVSDATGSIDGNTVTWTPKVGEKTTVHAVGSAIASGGGGSLLLWILIGAAVLLLVIVLVVVASRRSKGPAQTDATAGFGTDVPQTEGAATTPTMQPVAPATAEPPGQPSVEPTPPVGEPAAPAPTDAPVTEPVTDAPTTDAAVEAPAEAPAVPEPPAEESSPPEAPPPPPPED